MIYRRDSLQINNICCHLFSSRTALWPTERQQSQFLTHMAIVEDYYIYSLYMKSVLGLAQNKYSFTGTYCIKMKISIIFKSFHLFTLPWMIFSCCQRAQSVVSRIRTDELQRKNKNLCLLLSSMISFAVHYQNSVFESQTFYCKS